MSRFRKRPVVIEAFLWSGGASDFPPPWFEEAEFAGKIRYENLWTPEVRLFISTLEGEHEALQGDFIIQGVKGEIYPCKPDIFALTYEPAE